mgnify:CR=1 FL=1
MIETKKEQEFGVLVAVAPKFQPDEKTQEYLDELEFLVQTLDIQVEKAYTQKLEHPDTEPMWVRVSWKKSVSS